MRQMDMEESIPFNISLSDASYSGEIKGKRLKDHRVFNIILSSGEEFKVEAVPDKERLNYSWVGYAKDKFNKIIPLIGKMIEQYFSRITS
jgi:hypothetical protein